MKLTACQYEWEHTILPNDALCVSFSLVVYSLNIDLAGRIGNNCGIQLRVWFEQSEHPVLFYVNPRERLQ